MTFPFRPCVKITTFPYDSSVYAFVWSSFSFVSPLQLLVSWTFSLFCFFFPILFWFCINSFFKCSWGEIHIPRVFPCFYYAIWLSWWMMNWFWYYSVVIPLHQFMLSLTSQVWSLSKGKSLRSITFPSVVDAIVLDPGEHAFYAGCRDGQIYIVALNAESSSSGIYDDVHIIGALSDSRWQLFLRSTPPPLPLKHTHTHT